MVMTKEQKKEYDRLYNLKNKDKIKEKTRLKYLKNREKKLEQAKLYRINNPEFYLKYRQSPKGKKSFKISDWKRQGLISDDYDAIYEKYLNSSNCEECNIEYSIYGDGKGHFKCMDHCHKTGLFRNILCHICNFKRG